MRLVTKSGSAICYRRKENLWNKKNGLFLAVVGVNFSVEESFSYRQRRAVFFWWRDGTRSIVIEFNTNQLQISEGLIDFF